MKSKPEFNLGDRVRALVSARFYSPDHNKECRIGEIGIIGALNVAPVRGKREGFHCVDFPFSGPYQEGFKPYASRRAAFYPEEIELAD